MCRTQHPQPRRNGNRPDADAQRAREISAIHAAAHALGMDTADKSPGTEYRSMLAQIGGASSAASLTQDGRARVIAHLRGLQGLHSFRTMTQAQYIELLWSQLAQLDALTDPTPAGLDKFILSRVGVSALRFVDTARGNRLCEALKAMLARARARP